MLPLFSFANAATEINPDWYRAFAIPSAAQWYSAERDRAWDGMESQQLRQMGWKTWFGENYKYNFYHWSEKHTADPMTFSWFNPCDNIVYYLIHGTILFNDEYELECTIGYQFYTRISPHWTISQLWHLDNEVYIFFYFDGELTLMDYFMDAPSLVENSFGFTNSYYFDEIRFTASMLYASDYTTITDAHFIEVCHLEVITESPAVRSGNIDIEFMDRELLVQ